MDVLNTYGGGGIAHMIGAIILGILALGFIVIAVIAARERLGGGLGFALLAAVWFGFVSYVAYIDRSEMVRHEVTLRPGYVIDTAKYEVIEKRGEIYVIEEREQAKGDAE